MVPYLNYLTNFIKKINDKYDITEGEINNSKIHVQNNDHMEKSIRSDVVPANTLLLRSPYNKRSRNKKTINSKPPSNLNLLAVTSETKSQQNVFSYFRPIL